MSTSVATNTIVAELLGATGTLYQSECLAVWAINLWVSIFDCRNKWFLASWLCNSTRSHLQIGLPIDLTTKTSDEEQEIQHELSRGIMQQFNQWSDSNHVKNQSIPPPKDHVSGRLLLLSESLVHNRKTFLMFYSKERTMAKNKGILAVQHQRVWVRATLKSI